MNKYILGIDNRTQELKQYKSVTHADFFTEEWCIFSAKTLKEAKKNYEDTFLRLKQEGKIDGSL